MPIPETLKKRLLVSSVLVAITLFAIFSGPEWLFVGVVEIFVLLALNEYLVLAAKKGAVLQRWIALFFGALVPISAFFSAEALVLAAASLFLLVFHFQKKLKDQVFISLALTLLGLVYVPLFFSHLIKIHSLPHGPGLVFYTILLAKGGDAGAYFVGKKFGRLKLIEHVSPNKSVEGAVGGLLTTIGLSLISKIYLGFIPWYHLLILGTCVGIVAQLGDLAESLLKREVAVKDSGVLPGLGGILDVLDSLIFAVPFVYYYAFFAIF